MKNLLHKIASVFVVCAALAAFTACNDDDGKVKKPQVSSELVGSYTPHYFKEVPDEWGGEDSRGYLEVAAAWTDPDNIPGIDLSESMGMPAGSFVMPFNTILDLVSAIGSQFVSSGLVQLDLHSDGLFAAKSIRRRTCSPLPSARISFGRSRSRRGWRFFPRSTRCSALIRG